MIDGIQEVSGRTQPSPSRRLVKRGPAAWPVEQPPMSQADVDCHAEASHVRRPAVAS